MRVQSVSSFTFHARRVFVAPGEYLLSPANRMFIEMCTRVCVLFPRARVRFRCAQAQEKKPPDPGFFFQPRALLPRTIFFVRGRPQGFLFSLWVEMEGWAQRGEQTGRQTDVVVVILEHKGPQGPNTKPQGPSDPKGLAKRP